jgi:hypothetical protein
LFGSAVIGEGSSVLIEVPAGYTWILRDITWFQPAPGMSSFASALLSVSGSLYVCSGFNLPPGTNSNLVVDSGRFIVVKAGQSLHATSVSVADTQILICGTQLTNPA